MRPAVTIAPNGIKTAHAEQRTTLDKAGVRTPKREAIPQKTALQTRSIRNHTKRRERHPTP
jgi:hypothetical protein